MIERFSNRATLAGFESMALPMSAEAVEAYWQSFRKIGPRHAVVYRLKRELGWAIDPGTERRYLAPERPDVTYYG